MALSIVTLSCPNCGANLDVKPGSEQITCPFCSKAVMLNWGNDTLSQEPTGQSPDPPRVVIYVEQEHGAARPSQKSEVVQEDLHARERLADHALLQRLERERIAAEAVAAEESLRLSRLRDSIGQNQYYGWVAIGCAVLIAGCMGTFICSALSQGLDGKLSASQTISQIFSCGFMAVIALAVGFVLQWAMRSASRRQSGQIQPQEQQVQAALSEVKRLREQEAQVRDHLIG